MNKARQDDMTSANRWWWSTMLSLAGVDDIHRIMDLNQYLEKMNTTTKFI
jgi:hypothetical protein